MMEEVDTEGKVKEWINWSQVMENMKQQQKPEEEAAAEAPSAPVDNDNDDLWKDLIIEQKKPEEIIEEKQAANVETQTEIVIDTEGKY